MPSLLRHIVLKAVNVLARLVDGELVIRPHAGGREQLDRIVVLGRRSVFGLDRHLGRRERGFGIAGLRQFLPRIFLGCAGRAEAGARLLPRVGRLHLVRRFARRLEAVGHHHRDDLAIMCDLRAKTLDRGGGAASASLILGLLQLRRVRMGENLDHAGNGAGGVEIEPLDAAFRDRTRHEKGEGRIADGDIGGIASLAGHLCARVEARFRATHILLGLWGGGGHAQVSMREAASSARTSVRWPSGAL